MKLERYRSKIKGKKFVVLGDVILDHYLRGIVTRLSPEAPVPVLEVNGGFCRPGGAANVAANMVGMGAKVNLIGVTGDDLDCAKVRKLVAMRGVNPIFIKDKKRQTTRKTRVLSVAQQICRLDFESREPIRSVVCDEVVSTLSEELKDAAALVVSDYGKGLLTSTLLLHLENEVIPLVPVYYSPKPPLGVELRGPRFIVMNRREAQLALGNGKLEKPAEIIRTVQKTFSSHETMVTLGEEGLVLLSHDTLHKIPAPTHQVFDVTGAGDTVLAVYAVTREAGIPAESCGKLATIAAGFVLQEIGTLAVTWEQMKDAEL